jgi:multidrug efflux pump subunit AcrA (membrane-fusion protein)
MATARVDVEAIETTKSEKLLAVVLALFLLIGGVWTYVKVDDWVRGQASPQVTPSAAEQQALDRLANARAELRAAQAARNQALLDLELAREDYRTALDAGRPAPGLERRYRAARAEYPESGARVVRARAEVAAAEPAAQAAQQRLGHERAERHRRNELAAFGFRLAFVLALVGTGAWLLTALRRRGSRWYPFGFAGLGFASVLALVMAADYVTDYIDPVDLGPLVLSLFGIGVTLAAFAALQRYLARRLPLRRVRKRECPFCGYPVGAAEHCEGCGRQVVAECATCAGPRRVGTPHCGVCGAA